MGGRRTAKQKKNHNMQIHLWMHHKIFNKNNYYWILRLALKATLPSCESPRKTAFGHGAAEGAGYCNLGNPKFLNPQFHLHSDFLCVFLCRELLKCHTCPLFCTSDFVIRGNKALALSREGFLLSHNGIATAGYYENQSHGTTSAWGQNNYYTTSTPKQVVQRNFQLVEQFKGILFLKIAIEEDRCFALAQDGGLHEWSSTGFNHYELDWSLFDVVKPADRTVTQILCTKTHPIVLTRNGKVFIPEDSPEDNNITGKRHRKLQVFGETLRAKKVVEIAAGKKFSFALTDSFEIYIWTTCNLISGTPQVINYKCHEQQSRGIRFWAADTINLLLILLESGRYISVYFNDEGEVVAKSILSSKSALHFFNACQVPFNGCLYNGVNKTGFTEPRDLWMSKLNNIFDEKEGSDLIIDVKGQPIHCHKSFVSAQCDYLKTWIRNEEMRGNVDDNLRLCLEGFEYEPVYTILNYFYTGRLECSSFQNTMDLIELTEMWLEKELQKFCVDEAIQCLSLENVDHAMEKANKLDIKALKEACWSLNPDLDC